MISQAFARFCTAALAAVLVVGCAGASDDEDSNRSDTDEAVGTAQQAAMTCEGSGGYTICYCGSGGSCTSGGDKVWLCGCGQLP